METRLSKIKTLKKTLPKKKDICFEDIFDLFLVKGYVRSGHFGNVYSVAFRDENNENYQVIPFKSIRSVRGKPEFLMKVMYDSKESRAEITILKYIIKTVVPHSPHVFLYYDYVKCDSVQFRGRYKKGVAKSPHDWTYVKEGKGIITFMEYAGITLEKYFEKHNNLQEQLAFLFQLIYTLCVFQKVKVLHYDIYAANITVMETQHKKPKLWKYVVKGQTYYVPVNKYIPVFIDFGQSEIKKGSLEVLLENNNDLHMLMTVFYDYTDNMSMRAICSRIMKKIATRDMIRERYFDYTYVLSDFFKVFKENDENAKPDLTWKL